MQKFDNMRARESKIAFEPEKKVCDMAHKNDKTCTIETELPTCMKLAVLLRF